MNKNLNLKFENEHTYVRKYVHLVNNTIRNKTYTGILLDSNKTYTSTICTSKYK